MLTNIREKSFNNGIVYCLRADDGKLVETTDTFLPTYTKYCVGSHQNKLQDSYYVGDRKERWMIGVSVMSGCPVRCRFCATGQMKGFRNLTTEEILDQVYFILNKNSQYNPKESQEFKINFTRMGEPFLNADNVFSAVDTIQKTYPSAHCYISTMGVKGSDFSKIKGNTSLQISVHALIEEKRNWLIPFKRKMTLEELGQIRTKSNLKTTVNLTLVDEKDFDINVLKKYFDPKHFFIKISPLNKNCVSDKNNLEGVIKEFNLQ